MTEIVRMGQRHIRTLAALEAACFSPPRTAAQLAEELENPSAVFLVAEADGETAGYCGMHYVLDEGYIDDVAVFPAFRRRGAARTLMEALETEGRRLSLSFLSLEVRQSNAPAVSLYVSLGYGLAGGRKNFYDSPAEDALIYTKRLT